MNEIAALLRDFGQGASNAAAAQVSVPVDLLAALLRKGGVTVPSNALGGSEWMRQAGLTREPENRMAGLLGEGAGLSMPIGAHGLKGLLGGPR